MNSGGDKKDEITKVIQQYLRSAGCSTCEGNKTREYCQYCTPIQHNNMWRVSRDYAESIAEDILCLF